MTKLIPADRERCQVEWLGGSFMTLGPREMERCEDKPQWIATETAPGKDGQLGSMSMCDFHRGEFIRTQHAAAQHVRFDPIMPSKGQEKRKAIQRGG